MAVPDSVPYNSDYCPYPYDPEKARSLLEEAGVSDLHLDFPFVTVAYHPAVMEIMTAQFADVGITLDTRGQDLTTWLDQTWTQGDYEISQITDSAPSSPSSAVTGAASPSGKNSGSASPSSRTSSSASDQHTDRVTSTLWRWRSDGNTFSDLAWVIPMFAPQNPELARADLQGIPGVPVNIAFDVRHLTSAAHRLLEFVLRDDHSFHAPGLREGGPIIWPPERAPPGVA